MRVFDEWLLTPYRLAVHEPTGTAVIADVHLGYSAARRQAGDAIPLPSVETALAPLRQAALAYSFQGLVVAGDLFEKRFDLELYQGFAAFLDRSQIDWLGLVPGNHDRGISQAVKVWPDGYPLGAWRIVHGDGDAAPGKRVLGHWHPCVRRHGRKLPCFLVGLDELILPAYSRDAAGVDCTKELRWQGHRAFVVDDC